MGVNGDDALAAILDRQRAVQIASFGVDPSELEGEERIEYIRLNVLALLDEVHELLGETGWKPWATSRHVNTDRCLAEFVDALHFLANIAWATFGQEVLGDAHVLSDTIRAAYLAKSEENVRRQTEGYTGVKDDHMKPMLWCRAVVSFWDNDVDLEELKSAAPRIGGRYELFGVWRDGGTVYVDAGYTARGSNAAQIRRYAAQLAEAVDRPLARGEHSVTLVDTLETAPAA